MPDIGDVLNISNVKAEKHKIPAEDIERHITFGMSDMGITIDGRTADVHPYFWGCDRRKIFEPLRERII